MRKSTVNAFSTLTKLRSRQAIAAVEQANHNVEQVEEHLDATRNELQQSAQDTRNALKAGVSGAEYRLLAQHCTFLHERSQEIKKELEGAHKVLELAKKRRTESRFGEKRMARLNTKLLQAQLEELEREESIEQDAHSARSHQVRSAS